MESKRSLGQDEQDVQDMERSEAEPKRILLSCLWNLLSQSVTPGEISWLYIVIHRVDTLTVQELYCLRKARVWQREVRLEGEESMKKIRVAIVGAGLVSDSHVRGFQQHPDAEVVAVCTTRKETAEPKAKLWNAKKVYTNYDDVIKDEEINCVDILTPPYLHVEQTVKAANAGKHIHCEKPFCTSVREGKQMTEAAKKNNVVLTVGESYVFTSSHIKARELIEAGEIGEPMQVRQRHGDWVQRASREIEKRRLAGVRKGEPRWRVDPKMSGGGAYPWIFDHAVHFFAVARYLMLDTDVDLVYSLGCEMHQKIHEVYAVGDYRDVPIITWRFKNPNKQGVWMRAEKLTQTYDHRLGFSSIIIGTKGMIEVLGEGGGNLYHDSKPVHLILYKEGEIPKTFRFDEGGDRVWDSEISYYDQAHINQVTHFIDCVLNKKKTRYGGEDGTREVKATLAAIKSVIEDRPVRVDEIADDYTAY